MVYHGLEDLGSLLFAGNQLVGLFLFSKTAEIEEITLKRNWTKKDVLKNRYFSIYFMLVAFISPVKFSKTVFPM